MVGLATMPLLLTSCLDDDASNNVQDIPVSYVALYNASPNAPGLTITADSRTVNNQPLTYAGNTGYLRFFTGKRTLTFGPSGANNVVLDTVVTLLNNRTYSLFVVNNFEHPEVLMLTDTSAAAPAPGKAMIRFVNLSPDASPLALKVKDAEGNITDSKAFKNATPFTEIDAKTYNFQTTSIEGTTPALNLPNVTLTEGWYYTILVRGYKTPPAGNTNVLSAEVIRHE